MEALGGLHVVVNNAGTIRRNVRLHEIDARDAGTSRSRSTSPATSSSCTPRCRTCWPRGRPLDRQRRLDARPQARARDRRLRRGQGRDRLAHQRAGGRVRPGRHPRQRGDARGGRHRRSPTPTGPDFDERQDEMARAYPLRRLGEPEDVAAAIAWLASPRPHGSPARSSTSTAASASREPETLHRSLVEGGSAWRLHWWMRLRWTRVSPGWGPASSTSWVRHHPERRCGRLAKTPAGRSQPQLQPSNDLLADGPEVQADRGRRRRDRGRLALLGLRLRGRRARRHAPGRADPLLGRRRHADKVPLRKVVGAAVTVDVRAKATRTPTT